MELFGIPGAVLLQGGAAGVLVFVVLLILFGRLVSRRVLEDVRADRDARLAEEKRRGDEWRAAAQAQDARCDELVKQIAELAEVGRTNNALIDGLRQAVQRRPR